MSESNRFKPQNEKEKKSEFKSFPKPDEYIQLMENEGLVDHANAYKQVLQFAELVKANGGIALLVGGSVRDSLMSKVSKDFDIEVYGVDADIVEELTHEIGKVSEVGKAFGILKIALDGGLDIDVSLPRTDSKIGEGHRGFEVKTDPHMSIADAAKRRDFTMNSVCADPLTGKLYDPFGGVSDIENRILKITDQERFKDDPLRVLRALQFIGRFGLKIDPKSLPIIQEMIPKLSELPKERIGEEWKKLLLKSPKPSLALSAGMMLGVFNEIHPEFPPLAETEQEPDWHPEGNVWIHTMMVVDEASQIIKRHELKNDEAMTVMLSALCHDLGKPMVTEVKDGRIKSHGHEVAGEIPTKKFLASLGINNVTRDKVVKLVVHHLFPTMFFIDETVRGVNIKDGAIRKLANRIHPATIKELVLVAEADHMGRGDFEKPEIKDQLLVPVKEFPVGEWLLKRARELEVEDSKPTDLTRGKDWINFGFKPSPDFGRLISLSNDLRDEKGFSKPMIFQAIEQFTESKPAIEKLNELLAK